MAPSEASRRIAGNTAFLYIRMIVYMAVNLYTVRVLWRVLGVDDYGIYNVVGGIVLMFAFLNNAMVASSQRYISFGLGLGDTRRLRHIFSVSVTVHLSIAAIVLLLAETLGLWFLNTRMHIPAERMTAANWVYQGSVLTFLMTVISVPFNSCIVAHEHMKVYGLAGICDVILRLIAVLAVAALPFDRLAGYAVMILAIATGMALFYMIYCRRHFAECHYIRHHDRHLVREMFGFAGWSFLGNMGFSVRDQGMNIVLNLFFNVAVNAAKGIATQVGGVLSAFYSNFTMAVNPQITKRYAAGETDSMLSLLYSSCRYSLMLMALVVIPGVLCARQVLTLWLGDVAPYTVGFLQLTLLMSLIECVVSPVTTAIQATGRIRLFQIVIAAIMLATIPAAWIWLKYMDEPYIVLFVMLISSALALTARLYLLKAQIVLFSPGKFIYRVYLRTLPALLISATILTLTHHALPHSVGYLILFLVVAVAVTPLCIWALALDKEERQAIPALLKGCTSRS